MPEFRAMLCYAMLMLCASFFIPSAHAQLFCLLLSTCYLAALGAWHFDA